MAISDMKVYNQYIMKATIERVVQRIDVFNQASGGAIMLSAEGFDGDFLNESMFKSISSAMRRVDRYASNDAVAATKLQEIEDKIVKVAGGATIEWEPSQLSYLQRNEAEAIAAISIGLSDGIIQDQLNVGIMAAVAAIGNNSDAVSDVSSTTGVSQAGLNTSHAKFGDRSQALIAQIMDGSTYHKLIGEAINNNNTLFTSDTITIVSILNKRVVVTDAPSLYATGTPNVGNVLSLQAGGITITDAGDLITNVETSNGAARIVTTFQADYTFGCGIKGYAWDEANGGKSPTDAELATGTNWDQYTTSIKDTAGTLLVFDADQ